jgi:hypothetical protein
MVDNPSVLQRVQIVPEVTPGVLLPATKILQAAMLTPNPQITTRTIKGAGSKYNVSEVLEQEHMQGSIGGDPSFTEMPYMFASLFGAISAPSQILDAGSANAQTGAYKWVFDTSTYGSDSPQTYTIETGNIVRGNRMGNCVITDFDMTFARTGVAMGGTWIGQAITDNYPLTLAGQLATPTLTSSVGAITGGTMAAGTRYYVITATNSNGESGPSNETSGIVASGTTGSVVVTWPAVSGATGYKIYRGLVSGGESVFFTVGAVTTFTDTGAAGTAGTPPIGNTSGSGFLPQIPIVPIPANGVDFFVDPTFGALGTTRLTRAFSVNPKVGGRFMPVWPMDSSKISYTSIVEGEATSECDVLIEYDSQAGAWLQYLRQGTRVYARARALGPVIYSAQGSPPLTIQHSITWDMSLVVRTMGNFASTDGVQTSAFTAGIDHDSVWGKAMHVEVVTSTATL